ncbi:MAG: phosphoenolpyruvate--protein phosphotransferase [Thermoleophilia bacterium]|nr:phosphoenolpyruvate--protein phosphotransferase [Thermoleophilia bacterium]
MVGIVLVSHSAALAEGVAELARGMAGDVAVEAAGGLDTQEPALGTDAARVLAAVERADTGDGALVLMDLGSAVLSAELALDFLPEDRRARVLLSAAPLVEGAVAAAVAAQAGAPLEQVAAEARGGLAPKAAHLGEEPAEAAPVSPARSTHELRLDVRNRLGLHARPAARFVRTAAGFDADVTVVNVTTGRGPASARSLNALATLGVRQGHQIAVAASGPDAERVLDALRALAERDFDDLEDELPAAPVVARVAPSAARRDGALAGLPVSPGTAVGEVARLRVELPPAPLDPAQDRDAELVALDVALANARREITTARDSVAVRASAQQAAIFDAHLLLLEDEALVGAARRRVAEDGVRAARAWELALADAEAAWDAVDDPYLRERAGDVRAVGRHVLAHLLGVQAAPVAAAGVVVAPDLTPAETATLDPGSVRGIATAYGGPTSHSAILARSLGVPAVAGLGAELLELAEGTVVALDGDEGLLIPDPPPGVTAAFEARAVARAERQRSLRDAAQQPARTLDGTHVEVAANVGSEADAAAALAAGADAVGLLRTEFLFVGRSAMPDELEQAAAYGAVARALDGRPVVLRTLDVGADKPLPYVEQQPEANPFLGTRGIRLALARPELLTTQLRALLRAAADHRFRVMFPMVASLAEYREAVALLARCRDELAAEGTVTGEVEVGVMVEVPAAALTAGAFAREVDFFSIGTNDLSQYTAAAERGNPNVAALADALTPPVLRLIALVGDAAERHGRWAGVCGELAADPAAVPVLLGLGVRELSVAPPFVAAVKDAVRAVDLDEARRLAAAALELDSAHAVRELVARRTREAAPA